MHCGSSTRRRERSRENMWSNKDWKFPKYDEKYEYKHSKKFNQLQMVNSTPRHLIIKLSKGEHKWNMGRSDFCYFQAWIMKPSYSVLHSLYCPHTLAQRKNSEALGKDYTMQKQSMYPQPIGNMVGSWMPSLNQVIEKQISIFLCHW